ncbi:hemolysin-III channel protein-like protein Izh2 [Cercophora scortea]|uniref:Hemolysin-III channel protein-like protein Izh2 n=1 Tax=Cercophora scortea TaxID=314031 RepID=A0AAE0MD82_9PEZI|nr:hemolysin-III channel protein-like protein Izh2 [Cercophora scortea]
MTSTNMASCSSSLSIPGQPGNLDSDRVILRGPSRGWDDKFREEDLCCRSVSMNGMDDSGEDDEYDIKKDRVKDEGVVELLLWTDLAHWQQHGSELIHTGYRKACGSVTGCLHSWTYLHNETVNIFSHIVGAIAFFLCIPLWIAITTIPPRLAIATTSDIVVCGTYILGVGACFVLSTIFHTFMSHSLEVYHIGMKLDIQGILLLMWGATVWLIYYSFPCRPVLQAGYLGATTLLAGLCSVATLWPRFSGPHLGHYRAALFGSFGFGSFLAPVLHGGMLYGFGEQSKRIGLGWIVTTAVFNGAAVVVYTLKFPERWFPRQFDIFGASHQIMHVMVVCAALSLTVAMLAAFDFRHEVDVGC